MHLRINDYLFRKRKESKGVLINLVPVTSGGGLQNAKSFLYWLRKFETKFSFIIVCTEQSGLDRTCRDFGLPYVSLRGGVKHRFLFELFYGYRLIKNHNVGVVFTLFGPAPILSGGCLKISGFAYSNIICPEIPFWNYLKPWRRFQKRIIDYLRLKRALSSDEVIVETEHLQSRARSGVFRRKSVRLVKMSPSLPSIDRSYKRLVLDDDTVDLLCLCGAQPNKRVHLLAEIISILNRGPRSFRIVTTIPESSYLEYVIQQFRRFGVDSSIKNIGPVPTEKVPEILDEVSGILNISLLESFSNNWVEAWASGRPLIVTDADWARASCGKAAVFVDPLDPLDSANRIDSIFSSQERVDRLVEHGYIKLKELPSPERRFSQYIEIIEQTCEKLK